MLVNAKVLGSSAIYKFVTMRVFSDLSLLHSRQTCRFWMFSQILKWKKWDYIKKMQHSVMHARGWSMGCTCGV